MSDQDKCPFCGADGCDDNFDCGTEPDNLTGQFYDRTPKCYERQIAQQAARIENDRNEIVESARLLQQERDLNAEHKARIEELKGHLEAAMNNTRELERHIEGGGVAGVNPKFYSTAEAGKAAQEGK